MVSFDWYRCILVQQDEYITYFGYKLIIKIYPAKIFSRLSAKSRKYFAEFVLPTYFPSKFLVSNVPYLPKISDKLQSEMFSAEVLQISFFFAEFFSYWNFSRRFWLTSNLNLFKNNFLG